MENAPRTRRLKDIRFLERVRPEISKSAEKRVWNFRYLSPKKERQVKACRKPARTTIKQSILLSARQHIAELSDSKRIEVWQIPAEEEKLAEENHREWKKNMPKNNEGGVLTLALAPLSQTRLEIKSAAQQLTEDDHRGTRDLVDW